jgi:hypothetical protein
LRGDETELQNGLAMVRGRFTRLQEGFAMMRGEIAQKPQIFATPRAIKNAWGRLYWCKNEK